MFVTCICKGINSKNTAVSESSEVKDKMKQHINATLLGKVVTIFIIIFCIVIYLIGVNRNSLLEKYGRYTIGYPQKVILMTKRGKVLVYYYYVDNTKYKASVDLEGKYELISVNKKYVVRYSSKNPSNAEILLDEMVPDSIKKAPEDGWEKIPTCARLTTRY